MKNLNKKISAVALASMVLLGGVAASGAKSFANSLGVSLVDEVSNKNVDEFNKLLRQSNYSYRAISSFNSEEDAVSERNNNYSRYKGLNRHIVSINSDNIKKLNKRLQMLDKSGARVFIAKYNNKWFIVGLDHYLRNN